jgi:mevalonate kinase
VYGYPALALPVTNIRTFVHIVSQKGNKGLTISAVDIEHEFMLADALDEHPLAAAVHMVLDSLQCPEPNARLTIKSQLPIAAGMGSGAAVTVSIIRALSAFLGDEFDNSTISRMTFEVEKIYHGSPSGIDNTVITWEHPIYYIKGRAPVFCSIGVPLTLLIASSGITASTRKSVAFVRTKMVENPDYVNKIFTRIGDLSVAARKALIEGNYVSLGALLKENHALLVDLGVSIPKLDMMVNAAHQAGAFGAKLTGSGQGGNVIALVDAEHIEPVKESLYAAGSVDIWKACITDQYGIPEMPSFLTD